MVAEGLTEHGFPAYFLDRETPPDSAEEAEYVDADIYYHLCVGIGDPGTFENKTRV